ncbi:MAG: hypothetical protein H6696_00260 [Deferribacteres bacterium]|nr:hypothetical protein [candidate division KSB1 bacterium]MCB9500337.1 hypothetical protein [Deferribacteres bacterium]
MDTINKVLQTKTERHTIRPYIYEARMHALYGNSEETINCNCQSSSICGLIEYLKKREIKPAEIHLYGIYSDQELELDKKYCTGKDGNWPAATDINSKLETRFEKILAQRLQNEWRQ